MSSIDERFEAVHKEHPEIYEAFKEVTFDLMRRGFQRFSQDGVMHIVRYTKSASAEDMERYRINNDYVSRYARLFINDYPEHESFFRIKPLKNAA